jgi:hypothetical protein
MLLSRPDTLRLDQQELLTKTTSACTEMNQLTALVRALAQPLTPADGNAGRLQEWINTASRHHNGGTEGINTKTKLIKRQMYGRAGFRLLRHRILLQWLTLSYHRKSDRAERWTDPGRDQPRSGGSSLGTLLLEAELILADPGLDGLLAF